MNMKQISIWLGMAAIVCGIAFGQKPEAGNVMFFADTKVKLDAEMVAGGIGTAQFGLIGPVVRARPIPRSPPPTTPKHWVTELASTGTSPTRFIVMVRGAYGARAETKPGFRTRSRM